MRHSGKATTPLRGRNACETRPPPERPERYVNEPPASAIVAAYYAAFNARDMETFFSLVTDDVVHDINQGERETGKAAFRAFMDRMNRSYSETLVELVVMTDARGTRAAAEFVVLGTYLQGDAGLPPAHGQTYRLPAGAFFELRDGRVARITNYYNLQDWIAQVAS